MTNHPYPDPAHPADQGDPVSQCRDCGGMHTTEYAEIRCRYTTMRRNDLVGHARDVDKPPTAAAVLDLLAHLDSIREDFMPDATRFVQRVVDLGWRPVVGTQPSDTRTPNAPEEG